MKKITLAIFGLLLSLTLFVDTAQAQNSNRDLGDLMGTDVQVIGTVLERSDWRVSEYHIFRARKGQSHQYSRVFYGSNSYKIVVNGVEQASDVDAELVCDGQVVASDATAKKHATLDYSPASNLNCIIVSEIYSSTSSQDLQHFISVTVYFQQ
jgi:hypothetical protein